MDEDNAYIRPVRVTSKLEYILFYKGRLVFFTEDINEIQLYAEINKILNNRAINEYMVTTVLSPNKEKTEEELDDAKLLLEKEHNFKATLLTPFVSKYRISNFMELHNIVF